MQPLFWPALILMRGDRTIRQIAEAALAGEPNLTPNRIEAVETYFGKISRGRVRNVRTETLQLLAKGYGYDTLSAFLIDFEQCQEQQRVTVQSARPLQTNADASGPKHDKKPHASVRKRHNWDVAAQRDQLTRDLEKATERGVAANAEGINIRRKLARLDRAQRAIARAEGAGWTAAGDRSSRPDRRVHRRPAQARTAAKKAR